MAITRLGLPGVGVAAYGPFAPKNPAPADRALNLTRLGCFGVGLARYGTFLPKTPAIVVEPEVIVRIGPADDRRRKRKRTSREELEELLDDIIEEFERKPARKKAAASALAAKRAVARIEREAELAELKAASDRWLAEEAKRDREQLMALFSLRRAIREREDEEAAVLLLLSTLH